MCDFGNRNVHNGRGGETMLQGEHVFLLFSSRLADTMPEKRVFGEQKFTRRLEISTSTAENSARRVQNRGKPLGFSRYAEPPLN